MDFPRGEGSLPFYQLNRQALRKSGLCSRTVAPWAVAGTLISEASAAPDKPRKKRSRACYANPPSNPEIRCGLALAEEAA